MSRGIDASSEDFELRMEEVAQENECPVEAIHFVFRGLHQFSNPESWSGMRTHHVDAAEVCWRLHDLAISMFGPNARIQLEDWGVLSTDDFGKIVYSLINAGLAAISEDDAIEDFHEVFDFRIAFHTFRNPHLVNSRFQWRLSTMFVVTTLLAIAFAGVAGHGLPGAFGTLYSSWLGLIGIFCVLHGIRYRTPGWLLEMCVGVVFLALGMGGFLVFAN